GGGRGRQGGWYRGARPRPFAETSAPDRGGDHLMGQFPDVDPRLDLPALDRRVLALWRDRKVFERSLEQRAGAEEFVFYEGPPTANGRPGVHHVEARVFKDVFPRFKTMRGYRADRN